MPKGVFKSHGRHSVRQCATKHPWELGIGKCLQVWQRCSKQSWTYGLGRNGDLVRQDREVNAWCVNVRKKKGNKHENGVLQLVPHIYSEQKLSIGLVERSMNCMNSSLTASFSAIFLAKRPRCMEYKAIPTKTNYRWLDAGISPKAPGSWSYIYVGGCRGWWSPVVKDALKQDKDTCIIYIYIYTWIPMK